MLAWDDAIGMRILEETSKPISEVDGMNVGSLVAIMFGLYENPLNNVSEKY